MMKNLRDYIILILLLISLIVSILLSVKSESEICSVNTKCEIVYYSSYNSLLGIPNSYAGVIIFSFLILLIVSNFINPTRNKKAIINLLIIGGSLVAIYFLYIQYFILEAYCRYCLIVDFSMIICLLLILPELKKGFFSFKNGKNTATRS